MIILAEEYSIPFAMNEEIHSYIPKKCQGRFRRVDKIFLIIPSKVNEIFTLDVDKFENFKLPENYKIGSIIPKEEYKNLNRDNISKIYENLFQIDIDADNLPMDYIKFREKYDSAFDLYIYGEWKDAYKQLKHSIKILENDASAKFLPDYIRSLNYEKPDYWNGFRNYSEKIRSPDENE